MSTATSSSGNIGKSNGMNAMDENKGKALAAVGGERPSGAAGCGVSTAGTLLGPAA